jgi:hypothetical protein
LLNPKDLTFDLNRKRSDLIGDSLKIDCEHHSRTDWRANWRKHKRTVLTDITTPAFCLSVLPIAIHP